MGANETNQVVAVIAGATNLLGAASLKAVVEVVQPTAAAWTWKDWFFSTGVVGAMVSAAWAFYVDRKRIHEGHRFALMLADQQSRYSSDLEKLRTQLARGSAIAQALDKLEVETLVAVWRQVCRVASSYIALMEPFDSLAESIREFRNKPEDRKAVAESAATLLQVVMENRIHLDEGIADGCGLLIALVSRTSRLATVEPKIDKVDFNDRELLKKNSRTEAEEIWRNLHEKFRVKLDRLADRKTEFPKP